MTDKSAVLARLARAVAANSRGLPLPLRLCQACAEVVDADGGAITLAYTRSERVTLCATDTSAARIEDLQDVLGQGPGPDAFNSGELVIARLDAAPSGDRWPMFAESAREALGFSPLIYALPVRPQSTVLGVLTLYQRVHRQLVYGVGGAQFLADAIGAVLLRDPDSQTETSSGPWATRAEIHQATGIVVAQLKIGPDEALALLRAHAYAHDTSLDVIAADVVQRRLTFTTSDGDWTDNA